MSLENESSQSSKNDWVKVAFENLKGHPKETLAGIALIVSMTLLLANVNPWFATCGPSTIYLLYIFKDYIDNLHKEHMAEKQIEETELKLGSRAREKARKALKKRGNNNAKH